MERLREEIVKVIREEGVVGAGGAGFPTYVKINSNVEFVIANGVECEPLLKVDQHLMENFPKKIIEGLKLVIKATNAKKGFIALKEKYKKAITKLNENLKNEKNIEIFTLKNFYPAGDEQILVYNVLNRIVPELGIPLNVGVVVDNVGTLYNISNAYEGKPVISRFLTITGAVKNPLTIEAAIGSSIKELIEFAGGVIIDDPIFIEGGPLMGKIIQPENSFVTKTTTGIIVLSKKDFVSNVKNENISRSIKLAKTLCIQCNTCTENCSRNSLGHNIKPHLLMRKIAFKSEIDETFSDAFLCSECGLCSYFACPMNLKPHRVIQYIKSELIKKGIKPKDINKNPTADKFYNNKRVPAYKLIKRIDLEKYESEAPLVNKYYEPERVVVLLKQHIGAPSIPVKNENSKVKKYELIADIPENQIGSKIHSPINGRIKNVTKNFIEIIKE